ncbi:LamG-like jellyroll fold domain-containing protein [Actinoplanes sp. NPDC049265]|uniref:LamG-like jellyroll fold domain-containing protein n=1 Tax=Actinoplanes sp. NPDC049265 TaxID=3363902 RepID=UPI0037155BF9
MKRSLSAAILAAIVLTGVVPAPASASSQMIARYDFEGRSATALDTSGRGHTMHVVARRGGEITIVTHGSGHALQFPPRCGGTKCPHVVLQAPHAADLNPGRRPIIFGASVRLPAAETTKGQNVVQKGYSTQGSQYKLQIDGRLGRPSCVLVDVARRGIHLAYSSVSVADGDWHAIQCNRLGRVLSVVVDGQVRGRSTVPATLSVVNRAPLSIGGKGAYRDNDQFQGAVDDVWVQIG